jgi:acyl-CoA thioesterase-2
MTSTRERSDPPVDEVVARFVRNLDVERVGENWFVGQPDREEGRLFGGLVLGHAALAAGRTAPEPTLHSLHAYFLRPGRTDTPIEYAVERVRDGRTFTSRRVLAKQAGEAICDVTASFVHPEDGITHQEPMPGVPDPETLRDARVEYPNSDGSLWPLGPVEWRTHEPPDRLAGPGESTTVHEWMRMRAPLPDDPPLHAAALVYFSDAGSFAGIERRYGWEGMVHKASASLDHAIWIHRPIVWDGWLLSVTSTPVANAARPLTYRQFYRRDGTHVASMAQEAIVRRSR